MWDVSHSRPVLYLTDRHYAPDSLRVFAGFAHPRVTILDVLSAQNALTWITYLDANAVARVGCVPGVNALGVNHRNDVA